MANEIRISRSELHNRVWTTPVSNLAKEFGLSDVGLAKIFKKHNIPRPPRGYWAQVRHGVAVGSEQLPDPDHNPEVVIRGRQPCPAAPHEQGEFTNIFDRALAIEAHWPRIVVEEDRALRGGTAELLEALRAEQVDEWGRSIPDHTATLDVRTGKKLLVRAHLLMDALFVELERRGCEVRPVRSRGEGTFVSFCGEFVGVEIIEILKVEAVGQGGATVRSGDYEDPPRPPEFAEQSVVSTGRLTLRLHPTVLFWEKGLRQTWRDGKRQSPEHCLNDIIVGIIRIAAFQKTQRAVGVTRSAERQASEEPAKVLAGQAAKEAVRKAKLDAEIEKWTAAESIRNYVTAARKRLGDSSSIDPKEAKWLEWAGKRAAQIDPLSPENVPRLGTDVDDEDPEFRVRPAAPSEYGQIAGLVRRIYTETFGSEIGSEQAELLEALHACGACDPELSLVAVCDGHIVGYVLFTNVGVRGRPGICGIALGPLCVTKEYRRRGIGTELVDTGMVDAIEARKAFALVQGPLPATFYKPFDFEPASDHGIERPFDSESDMFWNFASAPMPGSRMVVEFPAPWSPVTSAL